MVPLFNTNLPTVTLMGNYHFILHATFISNFLLLIVMLKECDYIYSKCILLLIKLDFH